MANRPSLRTPGRGPFSFQRVRRVTGSFGLTLVLQREGKPYDKRLVCAMQCNGAVMRRVKAGLLQVEAVLVCRAHGPKPSTNQYPSRAFAVLHSQVLGRGSYPVLNRKDHVLCIDSTQSMDREVIMKVLTR